MTTNLARTVRRRGDLVRARRLYEEVVQVEPSAHNHQFLGWVCFGLGDVETARREHTRALRACATTTPTCGGCGTFADCRPYVGLTLSMMKYELGDVAGALATVEASAKALAGGTNLTDDAWAAGIRGDLLVARDDFAEARRAYERAIELTLTTGERGSLADRRRSLAELELEKGRFAEAETLARAAAGSFRTERIVDRGARAEAILALALVARGKNDDARRVEAEVRRAQPQVQDQVVRIALAVHLARLDAAQGRTAAAREALQSAIGDAEALGFVASAMAARLALAEIDGPAVAAPLARDARARGFALVARKASALATP